MSVDLERDLQAALDVDPSPEFVARVRQRIANGPAPWTGRASWLLPSAGVAVAVVAAIALVWRPATVPVATRPELLNARTFPALALPSTADRPRVLQVPVTRPDPRGEEAARPAVVRRSDQAASPAVLLDPAETRALARLVAGRSLNVDRPYVGPSLDAIEIVPISIDPLPTGSEGVRQ